MNSMTVPRLSSSDKVTDPMLQVNISDQLDTNQLPDFSIGNMKVKALYAYDNLQFTVYLCKCV